MERSVNNEDVSNRIIDRVHEGMPVCDRAGHDFGKVRQVFLGSVPDKMNQQGVGPTSGSSPEQRDKTLTDYIAQIFTDERLPEVLRERLLRDGFIQIDTSGLFSSDRFALADQIEAVTEDCVKLSVSKDELIKR